jgi:hypothetical protein
MFRLLVSRDPWPTRPDVSKETAVTRYIQTFATSPVAGREDEFNHWYDDVHMPEVLATPGFVAGQRYALAGPGAEDRPRYLAVYEIETDDLSTTLEGLAANAKNLTRSDAMDYQTVVATVYRAVGERRAT